MNTSVPQLISRVVAKPLVVAVIVYQKTLSPDHSWRRQYYPYGYCRFSPTCSTYAKNALEKDGILGVYKIVWRLVRCNPWSRGGHDHYRTFFTNSKTLI